MGVKQGICEVCGFHDNSYSIEENGVVMKVCKFCHDGYLEKNGVPIEEDVIKDVTLTLDLDSADDIDQSMIEENLNMKVEPLSEEELNQIISTKKKKKQVPPVTAETQGEGDVKEQHKEKEVKLAKKKPDILEQANPTIDDDRISITSPEVKLRSDIRPKTNLDVAISEFKGHIKFLNAFNLVFNKVVYAIFLGVVTLSVATVLFIIRPWQQGLIVFGGGVCAIALSFFLMQLLSYRIDLERRSSLLRIRQQEILFKSLGTDCYRELKTKYPMLKALGWLISKLSVVLTVISIVGVIVAGIIASFLYYFWIFPIALLGAIIVGLVVHAIVRFCADLVSIALDKERNQQISQQTMLDILKELRK